MGQLWLFSVVSARHICEPEQPVLVYESYFLALSQKTREKPFCKGALRFYFLLFHILSSAATSSMLDLEPLHF